MYIHVKKCFCFIRYVIFVWGKERKQGKQNHILITQCGSLRIFSWVSIHIDTVWKSLSSFSRKVEQMGLKQYKQDRTVRTTMSLTTFASVSCSVLLELKPRLVSYSQNSERWGAVNLVILTIRVFCNYNWLHVRPPINE